MAWKGSGVQFPLAPQLSPLEVAILLCLWGLRVVMGSVNELFTRPHLSTESLWNVLESLLFNAPRPLDFPVPHRPLRSG